MDVLKNHSNKDEVDDVVNESIRNGSRMMFNDSMFAPLSSAEIPRLAGNLTHLNCLANRESMTSRESLVVMPRSTGKPGFMFAESLGYGVKRGLKESR